MSLKLSKKEGEMVRCTMDQGLFVKCLHNNAFIVNDFELSFDPSEIFRIYIK